MRWFQHEMKKMRLSFFQVFLRGNLLGHQLVLRFTIMTKNQKIIRISRILTDLPMPISPMKKNTAFVIIEEEEDPVQEKQFVE